MHGNTADFHHEKENLAIQRDYDAQRKNTPLSFMAIVCTVLHPQSRVRIIWDHVNACSLFVVAVLLPLFIGFDLTANQFSASSLVMVVIDAIFLLDVWMSFRCAFQ